jgi:hypothetical protein
MGYADQEAVVPNLKTENDLLKKDILELIKELDERIKYSKDALEYYKRYDVGNALKVSNYEGEIETLGDVSARLRYIVINYEANN